VAGLRHVLRQPDFFRLWIGQIISSIGDRFYQLALLSLVLGLNQGTQIGKEGARVVFIGMLPGLLFAPWIGLAVDRFDRRRTLIFADLSRVVLVLSLFYIWFVLKDLALVYVVVFLMGWMNALFIPARQAALPQLVDRKDLIPANALIALVGVIASLVGTLCAGFVASVFGARSCFWMTAIGFVVSAFFIFRIGASLRPAPGEVHESKWREIAAGWHAILEAPSIARVVILAILFAFVSGFFMISVLEFAVGTLDLAVLHKWLDSITRLLAHFAPKPPVFQTSLVAIGLLLGALGVGMGAGVLISGKSRRWTRRGFVPYAAYLLTGLLILLFSEVHGYAAALGVCFLLGIGSALFTIPNEARIQTDVSDALRGRVFALRNFGTTVAFLVALGCHLSGTLLKDLGPSLLIKAMAAFMIVTVVPLFLWGRKEAFRIWGAEKKA